MPPCSHVQAGEHCTAHLCAPFFKDVHHYWDAQDVRNLGLDSAQEFDGGARGNPGKAGAGAVLVNDATGEEVSADRAPLASQSFCEEHNQHV